MIREIKSILYKNKKSTISILPEKCDDGEASVMTIASLDTDEDDASMCSFSCPPSPTTTPTTATTNTATNTATDTNGTTAKTNTTNPQNKSVKFDKIIIREYAMTVGDNPSCSGGAPISLGWEYNADHTEVSVDEYEHFCDKYIRTHSHSHSRGHDRNNKHGHKYSQSQPAAKRLSKRNRHRMLLNCGVSVSQIKGAVKDCKLVQEQRRQTIDEVQVHVEVPKVKNRLLQLFINFLYI